MNLKGNMVAALRQDCYGKIQLARMNILVLMNNPSGTGGHPDIMETIQGQLDIISQQQGRLAVLDGGEYDKE